MASAIFAVLVGFVVWYEVESRAMTRSDGGREVTVAIQPGEPVGKVIDRLSSGGAIGSPSAFRVFSALHGAPRINPGFYSVPPGSTFAAAKQILEAAPNTNALDVPAGFTIREVLARLRTQVPQPYVASLRTIFDSGAVTSPYSPPGSTDLEGLIGPGRYLMPPSMTPRDLAEAMVGRFNAMAARAGLRASEQVRGRAAYSIVIQASVIEKEGYQVRNMAKVSTVIENRLSKDMPLQMDSTVLYSLHQDGGPVTPAMLKIPSPYNTYLNRGLPPTPICTVSAEALAAALRPPAGPWLYFTVVDKTGLEAFSTTFAEQLANERLAAQRGL